MIIRIGESDDFDVLRLAGGGFVTITKPKEYPCQHYNIEPLRDMTTAGWYDYQCKKCNKQFTFEQAKTHIDLLMKENNIMKPQNSLWIRSPDEVHLTDAEMAARYAGKDPNPELEEPNHGPGDPEGMDPPTCPICDFAHFFGRCGSCGYYEVIESGGSAEPAADESFALNIPNDVATDRIEVEIPEWNKNTIPFPDGHEVAAELRAQQAEHEAQVPLKTEPLTGMFFRYEDSQDPDLAGEVLAEMVNGEMHIPVNIDPLAHVVVTKENAMRFFNLVDAGVEDKRALPVSLICSALIANMEMTENPADLKVSVQEFLGYINQRRVTDLSDFNTGSGVKDFHRDAVNKGIEHAEAHIADVLLSDEARAVFEEEFDCWALHEYYIGTEKFIGIHKQWDDKPDVIIENGFLPTSRFMARGKMKALRYAAAVTKVLQWMKVKVV